MLLEKGLTPCRVLVFVFAEDFDLKRVFPDPNWELPNTEEGGRSLGVNDLTEDGGGPAGVVEGFGGRPLVGLAKILAYL